MYFAANEGFLSALLQHLLSDSPPLRYSIMRTHLVISSARKTPVCTANSHQMCHGPAMAVCRRETRTWHCVLPCLGIRGTTGIEACYCNTRCCRHCVDQAHVLDPLMFIFSKYRSSHDLDESIKLIYSRLDVDNSGASHPLLLPPLLFPFEYEKGPGAHCCTAGVIGLMVELL